jgi:hypothetical protein
MMAAMAKRRAAPTKPARPLGTKIAIGFFLTMAAALLIVVAVSVYYRLSGRTLTEASAPEAPAVLAIPPSPATDAEAAAPAPAAPAPAAAGNVGDNAEKQAAVAGPVHPKPLKRAPAPLPAAQTVAAPILPVPKAPESPPANSEQPPASAKKKTVVTGDGS